MAEEKQENKTEQKKDASPAGEAPAAGKGRKKLSKMTLNEVESALKAAKDSMGGGKSKYIEHLEQRKKELQK
ncbi:MAG: hypothetical protein JW728_05705 [Candidatus Aureabacteria bacterium]|nr:hypothetical protein [Candidatus Auribacterota bacterium]